MKVWHIEDRTRQNKTKQREREREINSQHQVQKSVFYENLLQIMQKYKSLSFGAQPSADPHKWYQLAVCRTHIEIIYKWKNGHLQYYCTMFKTTEMLLKRWIFGNLLRLIISSVDISIWYWALPYSIGHNVSWYTIWGNKAILFICFLYSHCLNSLTSRNHLS